MWLFKGWVRNTMALGNETILVFLNLDIDAFACNNKCDKHLLALPK